MKRLIITIYSFLLISGLPATLYAAESNVLIISTPKNEVSVGDQFTISVGASSPNQSMNAVSGVLIYPANVSLVSINKQGSVINFWTQEAQGSSGRIPFEGVILSPGYQGGYAKIFTATFTAKRDGVANFYFADGAILANDGLGTNIIDSLGTATLRIKSGLVIESTEFTLQNTPVRSSRLVSLPVITDYPSLVGTKEKILLKGKGEPNALTKITFNDTSSKSLGERFIELLQSKKKKLDPVLVKNDKDGHFEYTTGSNLLAGAYSATPFLVDANTQVERPGLGVKLLVNDSKLVKYLVVLINVLGLLIPVVGLVVVIYFIPWYSWRRMRVLRKKLGLEERKIEISENQLVREDRVLDNTLRHSVFPDER